MIVKRTANVKRNIIYALIQAIVSQLLPFAVRTVIIYRFGIEYLGLNSLYASILSVLSLMELGFGTAVVFSLYKPIADGNTKLICAYLSYYRKIYRIIGVVVLLVGLSLMPFLKYLVADPELPGELNLYYCYIVILGNAVISYLLFGYITAIPIAYQRRDILSRIGIFIAVFKSAIQIIVLFACSYFYLFLITLPVTTIIQNTVVFIIIRKMYPGLCCKGTINIEQKRALNKKVYGLLVNKLTNVSRNSIDSLCISSFIGLAFTGIYSNYYYIFAALLSFSSIVCSSMMASVGNSIAIENKDKNYKDMRLFDFMYMAMAGWATVCMLCLYQPFIFVWVGPKMMLDIPAVIGMCIYFYILKAGDIRWVYHEGAGLWWECRFIMIGEAVANVLLNVLLCRTLGVFGIILATVISVFITNCIFCPVVIFKEYFKNGKLKEYWIDHISYIVTMIFSAVICWLLCNLVFPINMVAERTAVDSVICLFGRAIICTLLSISIYWLIWHRSSRFENTINWIKNFIKV